MHESHLLQDLVQQRRVNVYVTRDVAFDLGKLFEITKDVLGKLGCGECHSGRDLHYHIIEDFVVDPVPLEVKEWIGQPGL